MAVNKTSFRKGQGGRKPGKPNKATKDLRQWINSFIESQTDQIQTDWQQLEPKDRIVLFEKLLKYSLPTLQAINVTNELEKQLETLNDNDLENLMNKILEHYNQ